MFSTDFIFRQKENLVDNQSGHYATKYYTQKKPLSILQLYKNLIVALNSADFLQLRILQVQYLHRQYILHFTDVYVILIRYKIVKVDMLLQQSLMIDSIT